MTLYKILKYLAFLIGGLGVVLFLWLLVKGDATITDDADLQESILTPFLYLTYFTIFVAVLSVVLFVLVQLKDGNVKEIMVSIGSFVVLFLISFFIASSEPIEYANGASLAGTGVKWMETGLNLTLILMVVSVAALVLSSVKKLTFRK